MAIVRFTPNLKRFYPDLDEITVEANTIAEVIHAIDERWEGISTYIVDEHGALRKHVNIFIGEEMLQDKTHLSDAVEADTRIYIMQALSGG